MARSFNGTSDAVQASLTLSAYQTITVAFWAINNVNSTNDGLLCEYGPNSNTTKGFYIDPNNSQFINTFQFFLTTTNTGSGTQGRIAQPIQGVWHHYLLLFDMSINLPLNIQAVPAVYVDGVSQSISFSSSDNTVSSAFFNNQTLNFMCRNAASLFNAGRMADFAIWGGVLLTAAEAKALANGARPNTVRGASLVNWWPLDGIQSPEPDISGNAKNATLTGTALAFGPLFMPFTPRWPMGSIPSAAATLWAQSCM